MKMKEFEPRRGCIPGAPLRFTNVNFRNLHHLTIQSLTVIYILFSYCQGPRVFQAEYGAANCKYRLFGQFFQEMHENDEILVEGNASHNALGQTMNICSPFPAG